MKKKHVFLKSNDSIHLESCVRAAVMSRKKRDQYIEKYPLHCTTCDGWGGVVNITDPFMRLKPDIGSRSAGIEYCPDCLASNRCPRCLSDYSPEEDGECFSCGYQYGVTEGMVYPHTCICPSIIGKDK
ncbi:hypothetical protein D3C71_1141320 [compost metagenome]